MSIFLIRHATPDWSCNDLPYDLLPGPMLTRQGEQEAEALAFFLRLQGVTRLYTSPFERAAKTAAIVSAANQIPCTVETSLAEWRAADEPEHQVRQRMKLFFDREARESAERGAAGLVAHGGPIALLLEELGIDQIRLASLRTRFDTTNPLPPAGVWKAEQDPGRNRWSLDLVFTP